jgi:hypothetical protein
MPTPPISPVSPAPSVDVSAPSVSAGPPPSVADVMMPFAADAPIPNNARSTVVDRSTGISASTQALIAQMMN